MDTKTEELSKALLSLIIEFFPRRYILAEEAQPIIDRPLAIKEEFRISLVQSGHRFRHPTPERVEEWNRRMYHLSKMETREVATAQQIESLIKIYSENFPFDLPEDALSYLVRHPRELPELIYNLVKRSVRKSKVFEVKHDWQGLFGHIIGEGDFLERNFPLEPESDIQVHEFCFNKTIRGKTAFDSFSSKQMLCGIRACGKYIRDHEKNLVIKSVVALVPWENPRDHKIYVPVFSKPEHKVLVDLRRLDCLFSSACSFLVQKRE